MAARMTQPFWIALAALLLSLFMTFSTESFATGGNLFNLSRNFAFVAIAALGQTAVILTAGIDLSVGSVMGLSGVTTGLVLASGGGMEAGVLAGLGVALLCGLANGVLIAYLRLSPFVVTLGMLSIARSLALVVSNNRMFHDLGPDEERFLALGGGSTLGLANPVWILVAAVAIVVFLLRATRWGRYLYAIGGNEEAAVRTGVPVARVKTLAYVLSSFLAGVSAVLMVGWLGAVTNALGQGYELRVIAASVLGGANLMGGEGGALGAVLGAALIELIRNALLLLGVDPYWQGAFVGGFIILAVVLERFRHRGEEA